jgi:hypothetical protein
MKDVDPFDYHMKEAAEKMEGISPDIRMIAEKKIAGRYRQFEKDSAQLHASPDFYDRETQGRYYSLVEYLQYETNDYIRQARAAHDANLQAQIKEKAKQRQGREKDDERER